jgi:type IV pilus assembly protein PilP
MNMNRNWTLGALLSLTLLGCEDEPVAPPPPTQPQQAATVGGQAPAATPGAGAAAAGSPADPTGLPPLPDREISERDFLESPTNRDPFRAFDDPTQAKESRRVETQRRVVVANYALEELKMSGIISGGAGRVLVTDPSGLGHVLKIGDFVGKAEVVHSGGPGGASVSINWRLDRIRDNDVVFIREDPSRPDVPATTRVLSLRTKEELNPQIRTGVRNAALESDEESN